MLRVALAALLLVCVSACGRKPTAEAPGEHAHGGHAHTAPHGGTLVLLGDHAYNLEVLRDPATGTVTLYILDGHAENFVRLTAPSLALNVAVDTERRSVLLRAVANSATGETVGDTAQFEANADWLKGPVGFDAILPTLEIRGTRFENIAVRLPDHG